MLHGICSIADISEVGEKIKLNGSENETEVFVRFLGPAVIVVRKGLHAWIDVVVLVAPDEPFVIVGGVVAAARHHALHILFERNLIDIERHLYV